MSRFKSTDFKDIELHYDRDYVERRIKYAQAYMERMRQNVEDYIAACRERLQVIEGVEILHHVYLRREQGCYTKRINYYVGVFYYPAIENSKRYGWMEDRRTFSGRERKDAEEYAIQLARKHKCLLVKEGI